MALLLRVAKEVPGTTVNGFAASSMDAVATVRTARLNAMSRSSDCRASIACRGALCDRQGGIVALFRGSMKMEDTTIGWTIHKYCLKAKYDVIPCRKPARTSPKTFASLAGSGSIRPEKPAARRGSNPNGRIKQEIVAVPIPQKKEIATFLRR